MSTADAATGQKPKRIGYLLSDDFEFVADYYIKAVQKLESQLWGAKDTDAYEKIAKRAFYLWRYVEDMSHFGWPDMTEKLCQRMKKVFGTEDILVQIQKKATKELLKIDGQRTLGENSYIVKDQKVYLRSLQGKWHIIGEEELFLLLPTRLNEVESGLGQELERVYKPTEIDRLFEEWGKMEETAAFDPSIFHFEEGVTTPEEYGKQVSVEIKAILRNPPASSHLEKLCPLDSSSIENLFKVSYKIACFVQELKKDTVFPLYILRDGMMFAEAHQAMNILQNVHQGFDTVMIGRKLLSTQDEPELYWRLVVDVLYVALRKYPDNFDLFYKEYLLHMRKKEAEFPVLHALFDKLGTYIKEHLKNIKAGQTILVVDTGLQGSVNMLIKYLIDTRFPSLAGSDIRMFVVGDWFKGIYEDKFASDYYPMMKDIEILARSEYIYSYVPGSFDNGKLQVAMGSKENQLLGNVELATLATLCALMKKNNLL